MVIPTMILKRLYTFGSVENRNGDAQFEIKNRLSDATVTEVSHIRIGDRQVPMGDLFLRVNGDEIRAADISADNPVDFPLRQILTVVSRGQQLGSGKHDIEINVKTKPFGRIKFTVEDAITEKDDLVRIPRDSADDYGEPVIKARQKFVEEYTGATLKHIPNYTFDPHITQGNVENFVGVAQVPMGLAGPITINGEHAQGDFLIPLATAEGTLVASYNRGIKVINLSGGAKVTVVGDAMQRAPVFIFDDARGGREFVKWIDANIDGIRESAEATSSVAKLQYVDRFLANKFVYLRFNFSTGDAAGQNMVGRATFAACSWIADRFDGEYPIRRFYLESNLATDKKASQVNVMRTRGKRVTAECVIKRDVLIQHMRVTPEQLVYHSGVANVGAILSGANNNGLHSANGTTALFIATGQDVANVSESSAGIIYAEVTEEKDLYLSITLPSLIVATYGGGTGLATQREALEMLDCYGKGKVYKFAEIVGGVILAGEISLASAISSLDWVSSHEQYGRNR